MKLFFLLVKLQARWPLVPRISFAPHPDMADKCVESATPREEVAHHL
jgi:hypothetical protein